MVSLLNGFQVGNNGICQSALELTPSHLFDFISNDILQQQRMDQSEATATRQSRIKSRGLMTHNSCAKAHNTKFVQIRSRQCCMHTASDVSLLFSTDVHDRMAD